MTNNKERRRDPRAPYQSKLKELREIPKNKKVHKGKGEDISRSGMKISCGTYLTQGQFIEVRFILPWDLGPIDCEAQVQWVTKHGNGSICGVKFRNASTNQINAIDRYITESPNHPPSKSLLVKVVYFFTNQ